SAAADWPPRPGRRPAAVGRSGGGPAEPGSRKGTSVAVWTDRDGYLDSPPLAASEAASQADAATIGVFVAGGGIYITPAAALRQLLNHPPMAARGAARVATPPPRDPPSSGGPPPRPRPPAPPGARPPSPRA